MKNGKSNLVAQNNTAEDNLPEGWTLGTLGDVISPSKAKVEPSKCPDAKYLSLEHIEQNTGRIVGYGKGHDVNSTKATFHAGDVLYGKLRPYLNKVCIPPFAGICSTDILVFPKNPYLESSYLLHFLMQKSVVNYAHHHSAGVQLPRVSFDRLADFDFALPPLAEQKRIVAKVEELLAGVNAVRGRLAKVPGMLKRFRQSVLAAACCGKLTAEWRGKNGDEPNWKTVPLGTVCEIIGGSQPAKDHFIYEPRDGYIRLIQIRDYKSDDHLTFVPKQMARRFCSGHDVMIGRYGPPLFQILRGISGAYNVALMKAVPKESKTLLNDFLFYLLQEPQLRQDVIHFSERTVGQDGVRKDLLEAHDVRIPPLPEQHEIVRRVEALFELADAIEKRVAAATARAEKLSQSILAKAFRGELVPTEAELARREGRDYEPASVLLERVRVSREGVAKG